MNVTAKMCALPIAIAILQSLAMGQAQTPAEYQKLWRDPAVNARIEGNIEKYRKGGAMLEIVDAAGKPVAGARVEVQQTGHEFLFGCNAFVLGQLSTPELNGRYEEMFTNIFNFATVPFYWEGTEPTKGELRYSEPSRGIWRRPPPDRFIPWAAKNNITLKGHPLLWHGHNPAWLPKNADELCELYRKRFGEIAGQFGNKISIWDGVNESLVCGTNYPLYSMDRAYVAWAFGEESKVFPSTCALLINDVTEFNFSPASDRYFAQVKALLAGGANIKGIGFQYHYFRRGNLDAFLKSPQCDPAKLLDVYEKFGGFNLPLFITEITIPSAGEGSDELQAEVVRDHYRLWFSAPTMAGITWWNLGDGTAVKGENEAKGGLVDGDLKPKPAYRALEKLINEEWKTKSQLQTEGRGNATFRGFYGKYRVTVFRAGKTQTFEINHSRKKTESHKLVLVE